jgi:hypothetical protein
MGKRTYQAVLLTAAFMLFVLNNRLMIFEIRSAYGIEPRSAALLGALVVLLAVAAVVLAL